MRRSVASGLAFVLAIVAVTTLAGTPAAQTAEGEPEACAPGKKTLRHRAMPAAVVTPKRCPVAGREIAEGEQRVPQDSPLRYEINRASTPAELRVGDAVNAIGRAGARVATTRSNCRMGDGAARGACLRKEDGAGRQRGRVQLRR